MITVRVFLAQTSLLFWEHTDNGSLLLQSPTSVARQHMSLRHSFRFSFQAVRVILYSRRLLSVVVRCLRYHQDGLKRILRHRPYGLSDLSSMSDCLFRLVLINFYSSISNHQMTLLWLCGHTRRFPIGTLPQTSHLLVLVVYCAKGVGA